MKCKCATIAPASIIAAKRHLRRESMATLNVECRDAATFHALYVDAELEFAAPSLGRGVTVPVWHWHVRSGTPGVPSLFKFRARLQPESRRRLSEWQAGAEPPPAG